MVCPGMLPCKCMCVCMCGHVCVCVFMCSCTRVCTCLCTCMCGCAHACMWGGLHMPVCAHVCACVGVHMCACMCVHVNLRSFFACFYSAYSVGPFNLTFMLSLMSNFFYESFFSLVGTMINLIALNSKCIPRCLLCKTRTEFSHDLLFAGLQILSFFRRCAAGSRQERGLFSFWFWPLLLSGFCEMWGAFPSTGKPATPGLFSWHLLLAPPLGSLTEAGAHPLCLKVLGKCLQHR